MKYTIRNVPANLDAVLRATAKRDGKSLNEVVVEALTRAAALQPIRRRDLSNIAGTWHEDPNFDQAIADQHSIDPSIWA